MKIFIFLVITATLFLFAGCSVGHQPAGLDPTTFKVKKISVEKNFEELEAEEEQENEGISLPPTTETKTIKVGNLTDQQDTGNTTPPISLGLEKKTTPKENKGPAENAKQPASGKKESKSSTNTGNVSTSSRDISDLKARMTLIEERLDSSPGVMKGVILEFIPGETILKGANLAKLEELSESLKNGNIANVAIGIHTDKSGPDTRNKILTEKRKENIKAFFQKKGIEIGEQAIDAEITNRVNRPSITIVYSAK